MKNTFFKICLAAAALVAAAVSCSTVSGEPPVIEGVRVCDPEYADSLFTQATPGSMVAIIGRHLSGVKELWVNDQEVSFNATYNTDKSLVFSIPSEYSEDSNGNVSEFKLTYWNPELSNSIRLSTDYGTASYEFKVLCPTGKVSTFLADSYPVGKGTKMTVTGTNFLDIQEVYLTDINLYGLADSKIRDTVTVEHKAVVSDYKVTENRYLDTKEKAYVTDCVMTFTMPQFDSEDGYFVIDTPQGLIHCVYQVNPPAEVDFISSLMPVPGETVTVKGSFFVNVESITIGSEVIPVSEINVKNTGEMSFTMPAAPAETTPLVIKTGSGSTSVPFYDYSTLLADFDGIGVNMGWSPDVPLYEEYQGITANGLFAVWDEAPAAWWGTMAYYGYQWSETTEGTIDPFVLPDYDSETPASQIYLSYEAWIKQPFGNALIVYLFEGDKNWEWCVDGTYDYDNACQSEQTVIDINGDQPLEQWFNAAIPLSKFGVSTWGDFVDSKPAKVRLMMRADRGADQVFVCADNIRIEKR